MSIDIRTSTNSGSFYPIRCSEIEEMISYFNSVAETDIGFDIVKKLNIRAIITPHAGYIYSGFTANLAHRLLQSSGLERVIVIGPSHYVYFEGLSASMEREYQTPCGNLSIDVEYTKQLVKRFSIGSVHEAHQKEHSTETQMPFVKHYNPDVKVVELIYGASTDYLNLALVIDQVLAEPKNVVVISSDLSHFYSQDEARVLDNICLKAIEKKEIALLDSGCEACGMIGMKAIVSVASKNYWRSKLLDYRTSADAGGDINRVVGYVSAVIFD